MHGQIEDVVADKGVLVAVGGGKDSCVSIETMRAGDASVTLTSINEMRPIMDVIKASGLIGASCRPNIGPRAICYQ